MPAGGPHYTFVHQPGRVRALMFFIWAGLAVDFLIVLGTACIEQLQLNKANYQPSPF